MTCGWKSPSPVLAGSACATGTSGQHGKVERSPCEFFFFFYRQFFLAHDGGELRRLDGELVPAGETNDRIAPVRFVETDDFAACAVDEALIHGEVLAKSSARDREVYSERQYKHMRLHKRERKRPAGAGLELLRGGRALQVQDKTFAVPPSTVLHLGRRNEMRLARKSGNSTPVLRGEDLALRIQFVEEAVVRRVCCAQFETRQRRKEPQTDSLIGCE